MATEQPATSPERHRRHESDEIRIGGFIWFLVGFVATAIVVNLLLYWVFGALLASHARLSLSPLTETDPMPPAPRLQGSAVHPALPDQDLAAMRAEEDRQLNSYSWVDKNATVARVPIERAMEMLVARGLPSSRPGTK